MRIELAGARQAMPEPHASPVRATDAEPLAALLLDAYRGTVDDDGETIDDARREIAALFAGQYGELDTDASEVVRRDGALAAATLITRYRDVPFLAFSMTAPAWQRRGLARAGIERAISLLAARDERELRLVVTRANDVAVRLYERIGFQEEGSIEGPVAS